MKIISAKVYIIEIIIKKYANIRDRTRDLCVISTTRYQLRHIRLENITFIFIFSIDVKIYAIIYTIIDK